MQPVPKQSEAQYKQKMCSSLQDCGAMYQIIDATALCSGWPDRLIIHSMWAGYIEFKTSIGKLRDNQRLIMKEITRRCFPAIVLTNDGLISIVGGVSGKLITITQLSTNDGAHLLAELARIDVSMYKAL